MLFLKGVMRMKTKGNSRRQRNRRTRSTVSLLAPAPRSGPEAVRNYLAELLDKKFCLYRKHSGWKLLVQRSVLREWKSSGWLIPQQIASALGVTRVFVLEFH